MSRTYLARECKPSGFGRLRATLLSLRTGKGKNHTRRVWRKFSFSSQIVGGQNQDTKCAPLWPPFLLVQPQVPHCSKWDTSCYQCFSILILGDGFWFLGSLFGTPLEISKGFPKRESGIHVESRRQLGYLEQETKFPKGFYVKARAPFLGNYFLFQTTFDIIYQRLAPKIQTPNYYSGWSGPKVFDFDSQKPRIPFCSAITILLHHWLLHKITFAGK